MRLKGRNGGRIEDNCAKCPSQIGNKMKIYTHTYPQTPHMSPPTTANRFWELHHESMI